MFNPIECRVRPSRLARILTFAPPPVGAGLAMAAGVPPTWTLALTAVTAVSLWRWQRQDATPVYLRWWAERVTLYFDADLTEAEEYDWTGRGRRNARYLRLQLSNETGRRDLMIWRDSVSDASWRALNACYRVQAAS